MRKAICFGWSQLDLSAFIGGPLFLKKSLDSRSETLRE